MSSVNSPAESSELRKIEYLSPAAQVSMADRWFEIASMDHFWVRRRFEVLQRLCGGLLSEAGELAEIGCGHGLLQRQIEIAYGRNVTGFDLNEYALQQNLSQQSRVCCYNIFQMDAALREKFDVILLFDVLEHIMDEDTFLQAILFHLSPQGKIVLNVPAGQWAYSAYDVAAGHARRYLIKTLRKTALRNQLDLRGWTYWGLPLVPTLMVRKLWLMGKHDRSDIITTGFDSGKAWMNSALGVLSKCEWIPQKLAGTSVMAVLERFYAKDRRQLFPQVQR
jgi:2-polyprenyl-3-methyl-5-hydroxy-6-metoxy-1,4-benzoquinol methylase